jgi:hypothetical protein
MKSLLFFLSMLTCGVHPDKEENYTASTPAGYAVRDFLGISHADSIDFIRWKLKIKDRKEFELSCSYGISMPNTNGFINEKKVMLKGTVLQGNEVLSLNDNDRSLSMQVLNTSILHLLNKDGSMMAGNGGWSYTLNSVQQMPATEANLKQTGISFKDSIIFEGRTPCRGIEELMVGKTRPDCYKKKWLVYLYKTNPAASSGTYKIRSTVGSYAGQWKLKDDGNGKVIYSLNLNNGNTLHLLHVDKNIVYILDGKERLMVGDHDFSYSLNRRIR